MRVGLDASFMHLPPSGTGKYVRHLSEGLREVEPTLDLCLLDPGWAAGMLPSRRQRLIWEAWGVHDAARRQEIDLLHIPHFSGPMMPPNMPLVVTVHDVIPLVLEPYRASVGMRLRLSMMQRTIKRAKLVVTPSHHAAADIKRTLNLPASRIRVIPEAAGLAYRPLERDSDRQSAMQMITRLGVRRPFIFNAAGHDVRKNLPALIEAFAIAKQQLPDPVTLVIAGAPHSPNLSVFPPLAPILARHQVADSVILTGFVSEAEKLALYQLATLYITPSEYEGFGLTALEAMACGVPTIAADRTSLPEVVGDGGILVSPEPEPLAEAMIQVMTNSQLRTKLRRAALARAATFSWQDTALQTVAVYREALDT